MIPIGKVIDNADPKMLGRVRVKVPGRFEPSTDWLQRAGADGDGRTDQSGVKTPRVGTLCAVFFGDGVIGKGYYFPLNAEGYSIDGETIFQYGDFEIAIAEGNALIVKNTVNGTVVNKIELQTTTGSMIIKTSAVLDIQATAVKIDALDVTIMGRKVKPVGDDI